MDLYTHAKSFNLGFNQLLGAYDLLNLIESNEEERKDRERWYQSSLDASSSRNVLKYPIKQEGILQR